LNDDDGLSAEVQRMIQEAQAMMTEEVMGASRMARPRRMLHSRP
jgi:hypothetical protein